MQRYQISMDRIDKSMLKAWVEEARQGGYEFSTLEELNTSEIYWLHQECRKQQPPLETHQEPQDFQRWVQIWTKEPELYHVLLRSQIPIGVCGLHATEVANEYECGFTGILPSYAGRGLTRALKSAALLGAKERGVLWVTTQTHPENGAMDAVNRHLGFMPVA